MRLYGSWFRVADLFRAALMDCVLRHPTRDAVQVYAYPGAGGVAVVSCDGRRREEPYLAVRHAL